MHFRHALSIALSAAVLTACTGKNGIFPQATGDARPIVQRIGNAVSKHISHVVVIIQENRTLENFFSGYPGADAPAFGCAVSALKSTASRFHTPKKSGCPSGDTEIQLHEISFDGPDLKHDWRSSMVDWNHGRMDGFIAHTNGGPYAPYAYVKRSLVEPYWSMANQYVLADQMFPTEFGGSFTSHLMLIAGNDDLSQTKAEVDYPTKAPDDCDAPPSTLTSFLTPDRKVHKFNGPFPCFDQFNTIAQVLDGAGISWQYYATRILDGGLWEPFEEIKYVRYGLDWPSHIVAPPSKILTAPQNDRLASVTWVSPSDIDSDHPRYHSDRGPSWVASVVNAIGESKYWRSTAIIITWDDFGGWYDNVPPPQLDYRGLGIRVPCLIISPYAKQGYVSHTQYEDGSILKFIEEAFNLPSIGSTDNGYTDQRANALDDSFDFNQKPRKFVPIGAKYGIDAFQNEPPSDQPVDNE